MYAGASIAPCGDVRRRSLAVPDVEPAGRFGAHFDPRVPGDLGDRIGVLEQPRLVGAAAVVQHAVGVRQEDEASLSLEGRLGVRQLRRRRSQRHGRGGGRLVEHAAALERRAPELGRVGLLPLGGEGLPAAAEMRFPRGVGELRQRPAGLLGNREQDVARRAGVEHRLHDRLHEAPDAGARGQVVPPLERVVRRQQQVAKGRRLVEELRGRDLERHLPKPLGKAPRLGQGIRGVGLVHDQHRHLAAVDRRAEPGQGGIAVAAASSAPNFTVWPTFPATKLSRLTAAHSSAAPACWAPMPPATARLGLRARELLRDSLDPLGGDPGLLRGCGRRELRQQRRHVRWGAAVGGHDPGNGQRERRLGAGPNGQPFVGVEPGEVQPGPA